MRFRDRVTAFASLSALATSIFVIGGVLRWSQAAVATFVAIALAGALFSRRGFSRVSPLLALLGVAALLCAFQLIPLPRAALDELSPVSNALREDGAALLNTSPSQTLTTDWPGTVGALAFFLTLLGIAQVGLRMSISDRGRYRVVASVGALCGLVALTVGIHELFGLRALYGVYEPEYASPIVLGPLLNTNSLSCLMAAGAMLAIGLAAYRRQPGWLRVVWLLVVVGCGAITVATVSRGGTLAFAAGGLATVAVLVGQRLLGHDVSKRRRTRFLTNALPIGVVAGCMVILVIWMNAGEVERQLTRLSVAELSQSRSKFVAWRSAAQLVEEAPILGIGRGAFEAAFTHVHPASGLATYSHLENEYLQAVVDWGVLGGLALAAAAVWLTVLAVRRWRDGPLAAGALGALAVVAIESNVDFGLEFLGLAAPITAIAATLAYVPMRELVRPRLALLARGGHVLALGIMAAFLLTDTTTTLDEDREAIQQQQTFKAIREAAERHPLDYFTYAVAADYLARTEDPRAIRLLNHALLLHPTHPDLHRMAARILYRDGFVAQSTIEYAAALRFTVQPSKLLAEITGRFPPEQAAAALPVDHPNIELLSRALWEAGHPDVASLWLARILERQPSSSRACEQLSLLATRGELKAALIAGRRCADSLPDYQTRLALAQILAKHGGHDEILSLLHDVEDWRGRRDDKISAWLTLCDAHSALGSVDKAKRCLRRLDASPDMRTERRNEIMTRLEALASSPVTPQTGSTSSTQTVTGGSTSP